MNKNKIEKQIADIRHNLECVIEAQSQMEISMKRYFIAEKTRLTRLLNKFLALYEEIEKGGANNEDNIKK